MAVRKLSMAAETVKNNQTLRRMSNETYTNRKGVIIPQIGYFYRLLIFFYKKVPYWTTYVWSPAGTIK